jgi:hypothetical protein
VPCTRKKDLGEFGGGGGDAQSTLGETGSLDVRLDLDIIGQLPQDFV